MRGIDSWITLAPSTPPWGVRRRWRNEKCEGPLNHGYQTTTAPTVPLSKVAAELAEKTGMTKKDAHGALEEFVGLVVRHLKKGNKVRITGLGILQVRARPARMGRNPATGEAIKIKASKKVPFRVAEGSQGSDLTRFRRGKIGRVPAMAGPPFFCLRFSSWSIVPSTAAATSEGGDQLNAFRTAELAGGSTRCF